MTTTIEQLQQIGLNKYEAEAYYTLLKHGPLTGYEVGKHSQVPLSRSYDVLERLVDKGLALVQPGEPSRYSAQDPQHYLGRVRAAMEETLNTLTITLTSFSQSGEAGEFWVVRGRQNIIERSREIIAAAQERLELSIPASCSSALADLLTQAQLRGVSIKLSTEREESENIVVMRDGCQALIGTLTPAQVCQATVSANSGLIAALQVYFEYTRNIRAMPAPALVVETPDAGWIDWETRKQARLLASEQHRVA